MATFPAIEPNRTSLTMGEYPSSSWESVSRTATLFDHGANEYGIAIEIEFLDLSESSASLIRSHHAAQSGGLKSFSLSPAASSGLPDVLSYDSAEWTYLGEVQETHKRGGLIDVLIRLRAA